jgi:integrase
VTNADTGYLTQQPSFASRIPEHYLRRSWADTCREAHQLYRRWAREAKEQSRKPNEPIQGLLNLSEPLAPLFRAVEALDELAAKAAPGSIQESVCKRNALLLSMLLANPLRARNCILMTWNENGAGSLYQREDGQWRLRFGARDFKNERHASQSDYDAPLPRSLNHRIEEYLCEYRPRLLKSNPHGAWVFPGKTGKKWQDLNKQIARLTRKLIPETPGFAPHAIRHLVATDWLRKHPGDYLTAAALLHDQLRTVLENYSHLRQDDSFNRYEEHLNAVGAAMRKSRHVAPAPGNW